MSGRWKYAVQVENGDDITIYEGGTSWSTEPLWTEDAAEQLRDQLLAAGHDPNGLFLVRCWVSDQRWEKVQ